MTLRCTGIARHPKCHNAKPACPKPSSWTGHKHSYIYHNTATSYIIITHPQQPDTLHTTHLLTDNVSITSVQDIATYTHLHTQLVSRQPQHHCPQHRIWCTAGRTAPAIILQDKWICLSAIITRYTFVMWLLLWLQQWYSKCKWKFHTFEFTIHDWGYLCQTLQTTECLSVLHTPLLDAVTSITNTIIITVPNTSQHSFCTCTSN